MKFAHIADTHIRNLKFHFEYKEVFRQLYASLEKEGVDYIIHCGDIAHTKTQISPEFVDMARDFFENLARIAPTYIILGNHDGNLKNSSRQDAISPIVRALNNDRIVLLKEAQEHPLEGGFCLNVLSVFDEDNWIEPTDKAAVNIALYHGAIDKSKTDLNWTLGGDHDIEIFNKFDFAFLGDIHKTQILDKHGRVRYAGSTVQQNFGETLDKGYLLWDIESKNDFTCKLITFKNPKPFVTVVLNRDGTLPITDVSEGAHVRLVADSNISLDVMRRSVDAAKFKFKPESITYLNRASSKAVDVEDESSGRKDLRNIRVQNELIKEYLEDYEVTEDIMDKILSLNSRLSKTIEDSEEVYRNVNWSMQSLEWDGLFNYGANNKIDFTKLEGIVGIFGKNFSGKSSIIDSLLYAVYNSTSKSVRKNLNMINQNMNVGFARATIKVADRELSIERTSEKYTKKLKGVETEEATTDVNFYSSDAIGNVESLNGTSRQDTDKNIRKYLGNLEDFLMTSMASQLDSLTFINEGSTKRKEKLAKFLDLEVFDRKFKMAKEESADIRGALRRLEGSNYEQQIETATSVLVEKNEILTANQERCKEFEKEVQKLQEGVSSLKGKIDSAPTEIIDPIRTGVEKETSTVSLKSLVSKNKKQKQDIEELKEKYKKIVKFLSEFDIDVYEKKKDSFAKSTERLDHLIADLDRTSSEKNLLLEQRERLCKSCVPLLTEAINNKQGTISLLSQQINKMGEDQNSKEREKVLNYVDKYQQVKDKKISLSEEVATLQLKIDKSDSNIVIQKTVLEKLDETLKSYEDNKEAIENLEELISRKENLETQMKRLTRECITCKKETNNLFREVGSAEQQIKNLEEDKQELESLRTEFAAYELFMRCFHTNGISYNVIKNRLPVINDEIAKILTGVVDFEVFILNEDKKLDIFIKHPKFEPRPLEMGSGAEKTIASMAIRLALLSVSSLPKPDIFILDEPGTALDEDNMEGFVRIIAMVKSYFKTVILISHLDTLKDAVDTQIVIDKKKGFAHVSV
jgi:DNA repair protein SbcC/Rad50